MCSAQQLQQALTTIASPALTNPCDKHLQRMSNAQSSISDHAKLPHSASNTGSTNISQLWWCSSNVAAVALRFRTALRTDYARKSCRVVARPYSTGFPYATGFFSHDKKMNNFTQKQAWLTDTLGHTTCPDHFSGLKSVANEPKTRNFRKSTSNNVISR